MSEIIASKDYSRLEPIFSTCIYDRVIIDSVLHGGYGRVVIPASGKIDIARLDSGSFTILAGDPKSPYLDEMLNAAPIYFTTPQSSDWAQKLKKVFGDRISEISFTEYILDGKIDISLEVMYQNLNPLYKLVSIDQEIIDQIPGDMSNEYFFENYQSAADFLNRGFGFCIMHDGKVVSTALSMARSPEAIDIDIATVPEQRRQGLAAAVGAKLIVECHDRGLEPKWLAVNEDSAKLAEKLGLKRGNSYITYEIG